MFLFNTKTTEASDKSDKTLFCKLFRFRANFKFENFYSKWVLLSCSIIERERENLPL